MIELSLEVFTKKFRSIMADQKDTRRFQLLHKDEEGKFQTLRDSYEGYNFSIFYDHEDIEVYYNPEWIKEKYLNKPGMTIEKIEEIFKFLAYHEYGHSFFGTSSEKLRIFTNEQTTTINGLTHFNYLGMERVFREFFADFKAESIDSKPPLSYLDIYLKGIKDFDFPYKKLMMLPTKINFDLTIKNSLFIYDSLINTITFYVFDEWEQLKDIFKSHKLDELLTFFKLIFHNFHWISKNHLNLRDTRDTLITLIKFLNQFFYDELIYKNKLDFNIEKGLKNHVFSN